jgi:hypothetical protein
MSRRAVVLSAKGIKGLERIVLESFVGDLGAPHIQDSEFLEIVKMP